MYYFVILLLQKYCNFNRCDICTGFRNHCFFVFFSYLVKETDAIRTSEVKLEFAGMFVYCEFILFAVKLLLRSDKVGRVD